MFVCYCILLVFVGINQISSLNITHSAKDIATLANQHNVTTDTELQVPEFKSNSISSARKLINAKVGDKFKITCGVKGRPKPTLRFYNGTKLLGPPVTQSRVDISSSMLRVTHAIKEDSGTYRCEASNAAGNQSLNFIVSVSPQGDNTVKPDAVGDSKYPHWTNPRKMRKTLHAEPAGNTVSFRCNAAGAEPLTTEWYKNNQLIERDDRIGGYKFRHNRQLILLESVVLSDVALYTCVVKNQYGSINHTYELDVAERSAHRPILQFGVPSNTTAVVGQNVTFECMVYSDPHPHIQWLKHVEVNGSKINPETNSPYVIVMKKAGVNTTDADLQTLTLKNVTFEDAGEYTCLAGNSIGISHISKWLTVLAEPETTTHVIITPMQAGTQYLIIIFGAVVGLIFVVFVFYMLRTQINNKSPPRLVPIENPDRIPRMTKMEEPVMLFGNDQAWRRMCLPHADHIEINIQPDLQWELKREDILLHELIDEGFFGKVFKADLIKCVGTKKEKLDAAVKMLKNSRTEKDMLDLLTEMDQMKRIGKHKNIINLLGVCTQNGILWLVTEYAQQGNLRDYLRRNRPIDMQYQLTDPNATQVPPPRDEPLSSRDLMSSAYQVARGMDYLAQKKCVHRDLAARNVLVTDDYVMKIADFGLARDIRSNDYYRKQTRGHLPYKWMAPEAMTDNVFTHATDVWSFGILLWEIFSLGGSPYPGVKTHELVRFLRQGERLEHPQFASHELYRLMRDCWEDLPQKRPKFRQLVEDLDRMLAETSSVDYIDLSVPCVADYSPSDSDDSDIDNDAESSRDSANATAEDSDSVFEHSGSDPQSNEDGRYADDEQGPLLQQEESNVVCNGHARLQSEV